MQCSDRVAGRQTGRQAGRHQPSDPRAGELVGADHPVLGGVLVVALPHELVAGEEGQRALGVQRCARQVHVNVARQHKVVLTQGKGRGRMRSSSLTGARSCFMCVARMKGRRALAAARCAAVICRPPPGPIPALPLHSQLTALYQASAYLVHGRGEVERIGKVVQQAPHLAGPCTRWVDGRRLLVRLRAASNKLCFKAIPHSFPLVAAP